jgi:hypothetical protein
MIKIDLGLDIRYESRDDNRRRLIDPDKCYLILWNDLESYKRQMVIIRDYNAETNDFQWVWGIQRTVVDIHPSPISIKTSDMDFRKKRIYAHIHNDKAELFELTDQEVYDNVLMEVI